MPYVNPEEDTNEPAAEPENEQPEIVNEAEEAGVEAAPEPDSQ